MKNIMFTLLFSFGIVLLFAQNEPKKYLQLVDETMPKVVEWRRDFHKNPELSNREFNTQNKVYNHLISLGLEVRKIAKTGVVGVLKTNKAGPNIALRADMDALPVTERVDLPFKSTAKTMYNGEEVGVMHACGHDAHTAILLGTATILSKLKNELTGNIIFLFQPAEEGAPAGEEGGAQLMIKEGCLDNPKPDAVFGLHIEAWADNGKIYYKPESFMASADLFTIKVKGKQAHGATPWDGVDPITIAAQIINGLQTIVSRQEDIIKAPVIITVGKIHSGVRFNIVPEEAELEGTIRTLDAEMRLDVHKRIKQTAQNIAAASNATAEVSIENKTLVTYNAPELVEKSLKSLQKAAGKENVILTKWVTGGEDFSFYGQNIPSFFFYLGARNKNLTQEQAPSHHTPNFYIEDDKLDVGVKAFCQLIFDYNKVN
jgi:amidohydrolase